jgi:S-DNA-T family DNA segregation ATPase FtsK/SpoIIIE
MRRQARQIRRGGMQPMMVINTDPGQFPIPAGVILARLAWLYRSELAPFAVSVTTMGAAWWTHANWPKWWELILLATSVSAWLTAILGARLGLASIAERAYAATVTFSAGGWLTLATVLGPFTPPLPQILGIGTLILAVPWWAHRRRRAKVRVERKLAAWPDIARTIGLIGSEVMSATVDVWGWRARFRLARGQTIADVTTRISAIESSLGTHRGSVRVYPTPDDLANRFELRVLDTDPHADAIPWPGPSVRSITEPIDLGPFEDATPCRVLFLRRHAIFGGTTGSGKSGGLNVLLANLTACSDVIIWAIDLKRGMELGPWHDCIDRLATTPEQATALLRDAVAIKEARAEFLAAHGLRIWEPTPEMPALVIIIDEYAELAEQAPEAMDSTDSLARIGRAVAVTMVAATQRPTQKAMGQGAVRSQMDLRICFRVREQRDVDLVLGQGMLKAGWNAHKLDAPGKFLISAPEHDVPRRARAYLVTDQVVSATSARQAQIRRELDSISRGAMLSSAEATAYVLPDYPKEDIYEEASEIPHTPVGKLWLLLCTAPDEGLGITELLRETGMARATLYRHLRELAQQGHAYQVSRGHWRARTTREPSP